MGIGEGLRLSWGDSVVRMTVRQFLLFLVFSVSRGEFHMGYGAFLNGFIAICRFQQLGMRVYTTNNGHWRRSKAVMGSKIGPNDCASIFVILVFSVYRGEFVAGYGALWNVFFSLFVLSSNVYMCVHTKNNGH